MEYKRAKIVSVGVYVPQKEITNKDLEKFLDTSDEWIRTRTGIISRRVVSNANDNAFEIGGKASMAALENAKISSQDIDAIICATFTPDYFFPSTACKIQNYIGNTKAFAFDISAACAGFLYGLSLANSLIISGQCKRVLLVGTEVISKTLDWKDRNTCILFGDGAGAVVLEECSIKDGGILSIYLKSNGALGDILYLPAWGDNRFMKMNGNEVFKYAIRLMSDSVLHGINNAGVTINDIELLIPHQANIRIIKAVAENLGLPMQKVITNLDRYGNTSSASIPIALEQAWREGKIKKGTLVALTALGGGLAWGSAVVKF